VRILYLTKTNQQADWTAAAFLTRAFEAEGVEIYCLDYEDNKFQLVPRLREFVQDFDALLLHRGLGYLIPIQILRAIRRPRFFLFNDLIARHPRQHYLFRNDLFEHLFVRSHACVATVVQNGWMPATQVSLMLSALGPEMHRPLPNMPKDIDLLFIGSRQIRRDAILEKLGREFNLVYCQAFGEEMVQLMNRAKIILNLHAEAVLDTETRIYEALGCNGFVITEKLSSESPFIDKTHLVEAADFEELKAHIAYYLEQPTLRASIAAAGHRLVMDGHTYRARAQTMVETIARYLPECPPNEPAINYAALNQARPYEHALRMMAPVIYHLGMARYRARSAWRQLQQQ
jgi:hypothetical protein